MIIALDTNILIKMVTSNDISDFRQYFQNSDDTIAILTPVLSEFLVYENEKRGRFIAQNQKLFTQVYNLDVKSAKVIAELTHKWIAFKRDNNIDVEKNRHAIKLDIQIIGMCIANDIKVIVTNDDDISKIVDGLELDLKVISYQDLKPSQLTFDF